MRRALLLHLVRSVYLARRQVNMVNMVNSGRRGGFYHEQGLEKGRRLKAAPGGLTATKPACAGYPRSLMQP